MADKDCCILVFDVETTWTRKDHDQIIELSIQNGLGEEAPRQTWRIKPSVPISPGAQTVHGISMDDLAESPMSSTYATKFHQLFEEADVLVGYNVSFDLDMMQAEFQRAGVRSFLTGSAFGNVRRLWDRSTGQHLRDFAASGDVAFL